MVVDIRYLFKENKVVFIMNWFVWDKEVDKCFKEYECWCVVLVVF